MIYNAWSFFFLNAFLPKSIYCPSLAGSQCQTDIMIAFLCQERENSLLHACLTLLIIICAKQALKEKKKSEELTPLPGVIHQEL